MKKQEWNEGMNHLDPDIIEKYIEQKDRLRQKNKRSKGIWLRIGVSAACLVIIISGMTATVKKLEDKTQYSAMLMFPTWDDAPYSAEEIAALFDEMKYEGAQTNAYTTVYVPKTKYLYTDEIPKDEYLDIYKHNEAQMSLSKEDFEVFVDDILPRFAESACITVPEKDIQVKDNCLSFVAESGSYLIHGDQNQRKSSFYISNGKQKIILDGEVVQIDQSLSDKEIINSIQSIKNKLFGIFNVSFTDVKVIRRYGDYSNFGAERVYIYFYDESAHPLNVVQTLPVSDYVCVSFDNFLNYSDDIVSSDTLWVADIKYVKWRDDVKKEYVLSTKEKRISLEDASCLLYCGFVFGGHSCPRCMENQEKIVFDSYDCVDIEYVSGMPFYVFYKNIGKSKNGNLIYAKTYVAAIEVSGYDEYFERQKENH